MLAVSCREIILPVSAAFTVASASKMELSAADEWGAIKSLPLLQNEAYRSVKEEGIEL